MQAEDSEEHLGEPEESLPISSTNVNRTENDETG